MVVSMELVRLAERVALPGAIASLYLFLCFIPALFGNKQLIAEFLASVSSIRKHAQFLRSGGWRFVILYGTGWLMFFFALAVYNKWMDFPLPPVLGAGVLAVLGQVTLALGILSGVVHRDEKMNKTPRFMAFAVVFLNAGISLLGAGLVWRSHLMADGHSNSLSTVGPDRPEDLHRLASMCFVFAVALTHAVGGHARYSRTWRPHVLYGGVGFIALQTFAWLCLALTVSLLFFEGWCFVAKCPLNPSGAAADDTGPMWLTSAGSGLTAQLACGFSLVMYDPTKKCGCCVRMPTKRLGSYAMVAKRVRVRVHSKTPMLPGVSLQVLLQPLMQASRWWTDTFKLLTHYPANSPFHMYRGGSVESSGSRRVAFLFVAATFATFVGACQTCLHLTGTTDLMECFALLAPAWDPAQSTSLIPFYIAGSTLTTAAVYFTVCSYLENLYYVQKADRAHEWKIQKDRWLTPDRHREERFWGTFNAGLGAGVGMSIFLLGPHQLYFDIFKTGIAYFALSFVLVFLWIDLYAYGMHRFHHSRFMYKNVHKWHHRYVATTPFGAYAMHPVEFVIFVVGPLAIIFIIPLHIVPVMVNLVYVGYHAVIDHSGIDFKGDLPWQPSAKFHDDHHRYFHTNFGQSLIIWDWAFGTLRQKKKEYSEETFVGDTPGL